MAFPTGKPPASRGVGTPLRREYEDLPDVLDRMAELVREHRSANLVRDTAAQIAQGLPATGSDALARRVWNYVRKDVQYLLDPAGTELLQGPDVTLQKKYGDCDDQAILAAALLMALGVDAGFRAVAQVEAGDFDHVYVLYWSSGQWKELDTIGDVPPGTGPLFPDAKSTVNKIIESDMPEAKRGRDLGLTIGLPPGGGFPGGGLPFFLGPGDPGGRLPFNPDPVGGGTLPTFGFEVNESAPGREGTVRDQIIDLIKKGIEITPQIIRALKGGDPLPGNRRRPPGGGRNPGGGPGGGRNPGGGRIPGGGRAPGGGRTPGGGRAPGGGRTPGGPSPSPREAGVSTSTMLIGGGAAVGVLALILQQQS